MKERPAQWLSLTGGLTRIGQLGNCVVEHLHSVAYCRIQDLLRVDWRRTLDLRRRYAAYAGFGFGEVRIVACGRLNRGKHRTNEPIADFGPFLSGSPFAGIQQSALPLGMPVKEDGIRELILVSYAALHQRSDDLPNPNGLSLAWRDWPKNFRLHLQIALCQNAHEILEVDFEFELRSRHK